MLESLLHLLEFLVCYDLVWLQFLGYISVHQIVNSLVFRYLVWFGLDLAFSIGWVVDRLPWYLKPLDYIKEILVVVDYILKYHSLNVGFSVFVGHCMGIHVHAVENLGEGN